MEGIVKQSGGKFLGQGTYGCVFFPAYKCEGKQTVPEGVGKVFSDVKEADVEAGMMSVIAEIDKKGKYTNRLEKTCPVSPTEINRNGKCNLFKKANAFKQLVYKHRGEDLGKFMKKPFSFENMVDKTLNISKGIQLLLKHDLVHLDLKPENILVTPDDKAILIDFGLSRKIKQIYSLKDSDYLLSYPYFVYPPEFKYMFYRVLNKNKSAMLGTIGTFDKAFNGYGYAMYDLTNAKVTKSKMRLQYNEFSKETMKRTSTSYYVDIAKKVDVFSLGVVMATMLNNYQIFASKPDKEQIRMYRSLVQEAMNGNPFKRISVDDLITRLEGMVKKSVYVSAQNAPASAHTSVPSDRVAQVPQVPSAESLKECIKKHNLKDLRGMIDQHKLPKALKQKKKEEMCKALKPYMKGANPVSVTKPPSKSLSVSDCVKNHNLKQLREMIDKNKLPKGLKQKKKEEMCLALKPFFKEERILQVTDSKVSMKDCLNDYLLSDLKAIVDNKHLPKGLKQLKKQYLCDAVLPYLEKGDDVNKGKKNKK